MMSKVSVIIPAYNEELHIAHTIEALLSQSYKDFEVIVVDNNSTDATPSIIEKYLADSRVKLLHEPKQGILHARQAGLNHATGEVIAQLDADCVPGRSWIEKGTRYFTKDIVVGVSGPYYYFDAPWYLRYFSFINQVLFFGLVSWYVQKRKYGALMIGGNTFIRTSTIKAVGGYNTNIAFYGEDTDTACRISNNGKLLFSNSLVMPTSARRFREQGFFSVVRKYYQVFFSIMKGRGVSVDESSEIVNPR